MASAQLYFEDVKVGEPVRPLMVWMDQLQLVEWGHVTGNNDAGHWHIFHNRWKDTDDPTVSNRSHYDPSVTGQFKAALMEKMLMDWGGPKAWVRKMSVQYRVWDHFFELKTFTGKVVNKREEDGDCLVDLEIEMAREDGRMTTKGTATVSLPRRG
jgi:hypothetical protein